MVEKVWPEFSAVSVNFLNSWKHLADTLDGWQELWEVLGVVETNTETRKGKTMIEAYGVRGLQSKSWRKTFKSLETLDRWCEAHDAVVFGVREI